MKPAFPKNSVCKPCWELKYCPYGPLVEYFPFPQKIGSAELESAKRRYHEVQEEIKALTEVTPEDIHDYSRMLSLLDPENMEYAAQYATEVGCQVFGHSCPVFFVQSGGTETKESRPEGRNISRSIMLQVVRRDNHVCQLCHQYVPDDQIEFDHIIPFSKGGPSTVANIRLLCRGCNRKKSNSLDEILTPRRSF